MKPHNILIFSLLLTFILPLSGKTPRLLFYPSVLDGAPNLLDGRAWQNDKRDWGTYGKSSATLFKADEPVLKIASAKSVSTYWNTAVHITPGRTYLLGAWVRYANAKILFWNYGVDPETGHNVERRLYCFGGFNNCLAPYFTPESMQILGGDSSKWHLCYKTMTFPKPLKHDNIISVNIGLYMATGELEILHPFIIDVTDCKDTSLCIDIADSPKPIRRLAVEHADVRDIIWSKTFDTPVTEFKSALKDLTDFNRNQDKDTILGYTLTVEYTDGSRQSLSAPKDNIFTERH